MKKLLRRLLILAVPIIWRKIRARRRGGHRHHGHHENKRHREWPDWL